MISLQYFGNPMELVGVPNSLVAAQVEKYVPQGLCKRCFLEQNWNIGASSAICG
jgi:hypothetical protein